MLKSLKPTWYSKNLTNINLAYLKAQGVSYLLFDLDNTLASYLETKPESNILKFTESAKKLGFKLFIISNNHFETRVKQFATALSMDNYLFNAGKPKTKKLKGFLKANKLALNQCVIIGDQLLTDVLLANQLKLRSVLVEPKSSKDLPITRINRIIDNKIRAYFRRSKQLIDIGQEIK